MRETLVVTLVAAVHAQKIECYGMFVNTLELDLRVDLISEDIACYRSVTYR